MSILHYLKIALGLAPRGNAAPSKDPAVQPPAPVRPAHQPAPPPRREREEVSPFPHLLPAIQSAHSAALARLRREAEDFYASPESRLGLQNEAFHAARQAAWEEAIRAPLLQTLEARPDLSAQILDFIQTIYGKDHRLEDHGIPDLYRLLLSFADPQQFPRPAAVSVSLFTSMALEREQAEKEALLAHWQKCILLSGEGEGVYGRSFYYDPELQFFFCLSPDDNYYHWGTHEYFSVSRDRALSDPSLAGQYPSGVGVPDYFARARDCYEKIPEIALRLP